MDNWALAKGGESLVSFLADLSAEEALKLLERLEKGEIRDGETGLPVDKIRDSIRHVVSFIGLTGEERPGFPNSKRIFCDPFNDLLIDAPVGESVCRAGLIRRNAINPVWEWLNKDLLPETFPEQSKRVNLFLLQQDHRAVTSAAFDLRKMGAHAISGALQRIEEDPGYAMRVRSRLGNSGYIEDAANMAGALRVQDALLEVGALPYAIEDLNESLLERVSDIYEQACINELDHALFVCHALFAHLTHPSQIMRLAKKLSQRNGDVMMSGADMASLVERLLGKLEKHAHEVERVSHLRADLKMIATHAREFSATSEDFVQEIDIAGMDLWKNRLFAARQEISKGLTAQLGYPLQTLRTTLPFRGLGMPDFRRAPTREKAQELKTAMTFLVLIDLHAGSLCILHDLRQVFVDIDYYLMRYEDALIEALKETKDVQTKENIRACGELLIDVVERIRSVESGKVLRRRIRAALGYGISSIDVA